MCGIAGILSFSGPVSRPTLEAMNRAIVHRGPDDGGEWVSADGLVGLANRRLAILDLSIGGHQPMFSHDGALVLVFNGEIYNYVEIRSELIALGHSFRTQTDTEVVIAAYEQWGRQCVEHFNGMFAFALWDERRQELFASRDRFGEKPFYYVRLADRLVFASEIKALLKEPGVPRRMNDVTVARYLTLAMVDCDDQTFFAEIRQLPAAHSMVVSRNGRLELGRYWQLDLDGQAAQRSDDEFADQFRALLTDAVRLRLRSDVAVGSSLSGGLDSSSIVCTMRELLAGTAGTQQTFSARYDNSSADEGKFIDAVVAMGRVDPHCIWIEEADFVDELDSFVRAQDEPVAHTSQFAQWKVMKLARDHGVTVLLDGQGADEIIGGYPSPTFGGRYAELFLAGNVLPLVRELAAFQKLHGNAAVAVRYLAAALMPGSVRNFVRRRFIGTVSLPEAPPPPSYREQGPTSANMLRFALYNTLTVTSLPSLLRYGDRNSMAFSREPRLPFLDHRLVQFAYSLPSDQLVRDGMTKGILRRAMSGRIPDSVRDRTDKIGFATPERQWLSGLLRQRMVDALTALKSRGLIAPKVVDAHWQRFIAGGRSGNVWRLANLELWMQQYIDAAPSGATAA